MIPRPTQVQAMLDYHVPPAAVAYCLQLWQKHPFVLRLSRKRQTKLGDYRFEPVQRWHIISVNRDLAPQPFLLTFIHEVAHLVAFERFGRRIAPHGKEWKDTFSSLMQPLLHEAVFSKEVLPILTRHMRNPKASSHADPSLVRVLYPERTTGKGQEVPLRSLVPGATFRFRSKEYRVVKHRRTRTLVEHEASRRRYLIAQQALVQALED